MKRQLAGTALLPLLAACGSPDADKAATETTEPTEAAAPTDQADAVPVVEKSATPDAEAPAGSATEPPFTVRKGDRLEVSRMADCFEVGPDADDTPWQMFPGVTVEYLSVQDGKAKVVGASGDECLIEWDALKPS